MNFGKHIKDARKAAGLTQREVGERMGVSESAVAQYESGQRIPKIDTLQRIALAVETPLVKLLGYGTVLYGLYTPEETSKYVDRSGNPTSPAWVEPTKCERFFGLLS